MVGGIFVIGAMDLFFVRFHCRTPQATAAPPPARNDNQRPPQ